MKDKFLTLSVVGCVILWAGIIGQIITSNSSSNEFLERYEAAMKSGNNYKPKVYAIQPKSDFKAVLVANQPLQKEPLKQQPSKHVDKSTRLVFIKEEKNKK